MILCAWCKKVEFEPTHSTHRFCSDHCAQEAKRERARQWKARKKAGSCAAFDWKVPTPCAHCGKEFLPDRWNQKYCGKPECEKARKKKSQPASKVVAHGQIQCANEACKAWFTPAQSNHKTCCSDCSRAYQLQRARKNRAKKRKSVAGQDEDDRLPEFTMADPWPDLAYLPPGQVSWYSAQMMPVF